jgi:hypothetical protein
VIPEVLLEVAAIGEASEHKVTWTEVEAWSDACTMSRLTHRNEDHDGPCTGLNDGPMLASAGTYCYYHSVQQSVLWCRVFEARWLLGHKPAEPRLASRARDRTRR